MSDVLSDQEVAYRETLQLINICEHLRARYPDESDDQIEARAVKVINEKP